MNTEPHTHELLVRFDRDGDAWLDYGDQSKLVYHGPFFRQRIQRAARRMIDRHDRASRKTAKLAAIAMDTSEAGLRSRWSNEKVAVRVDRRFR